MAAPELLRSVSSIQALLVLSTKFAGRVSCALEDIAAVVVTKVLQALDLLCLEDQPTSSVRKFIKYQCVLRGLSNDLFFWTSNHRI